MKLVLGKENIKMLVLDEADEMLQEGFSEQIKNIIILMPEDLQVINDFDAFHFISLVSIQIVLLSATMTNDVLNITKKFMNDPIKIFVKKEELTLDRIHQFYINVQEEVRRSYELFIWIAAYVSYLAIQIRYALRFVCIAIHRKSCHIL